MTVEDTEKILKYLNVSKANEPDNISNRVLKNTSNTLSNPLTKVFNLSLSSGTFPDHWKEANVTPVFKTSNRQDKNNYRPISLLSNLGKILERFVFGGTLVIKSGIPQ